MRRRLRKKNRYRPIERYGFGIIESSGDRNFVLEKRDVVKERELFRAAFSSR
jgi:hypothetical protein